MNNPPTNTVTTTGFERSSSGRVDRRAPQNTQKKKSMLDKLNSIA
jgi:hypothetical protein